MRISLMMIVAYVAGSMLVLGTANAQLIAGWDFSQYTVDGALTTDGTTFVNSLPANYSGLDPTNNAGAESALVGTFHIDGTNGSTNVNASSPNPGVVATAAVPGSPALTLNRNATAVSTGDNSFDSFSILAGEGQTYTSELGITARNVVDVVFQAGKVGVALPDWGVSFAGRTVSGTSNVDVAFSTNCSAYSAVGTVVLDETERLFNLVVLSGASIDVGCVRLSLDPNGGQPIIDNVAVVPEPDATSAIVAGVLGLLGLTHRRRV